MSEYEHKGLASMGRLLNAIKDEFGHDAKITLIVRVYGQDGDLDFQMEESAIYRRIDSLNS